MSSRNVIRGFHGTTRIRADNILASDFTESTSDHSWLGRGRYFFQDGPIHAYNWARNSLKRPSRKGEGQPVILQVDIDITDCMDLTDAMHWVFIKAIFEKSGSGVRKQLSPLALYLRGEFVDHKKIGFNYEDFILMEAAIEALREEWDASGRILSTVKAAFIEGKPIHPTSWLFTQSCVAISVINPVAMVSRPVEIDPSSLFS